MTEKVFEVITEEVYNGFAEDIPQETMKRNKHLTFFETFVKWMIHLEIFYSDFLRNY